jgi:hypothetical protein
VDLRFDQHSPAGLIAAGIVALIVPPVTLPSTIVKVPTSRMVEPSLLVIMKSVLLTDEGVDPIRSSQCVGVEPDGKAAL